MASKILVLGAGELGTSVLKALAAIKSPNTTLTVLLRPQTIAQNKSPTLPLLRSLNITFLPGDISLPTSELVALFKPFNTIISCLGFASDSGSQLKICTAVLEAGVKRFFPWQFGVDYDVIGRGSAQGLFDEQLDVRDLLRGQAATEWVIVSTGMFTDFLFLPAFGVVDVKKRTVMGLGGWDNRITVTGVEDIGRVVARMIFEEEEKRPKNEVVFTAGETLSYGELANVVEEVMGCEIRRELWKEVEGEKDGMEMYRTVFGRGKGVSWDKHRSWNAMIGIEMEDVKTWLLKNIESLKA